MLSDALFSPILSFVLFLAVLSYLRLFTLFEDLLSLEIYIDKYAANSYSRETSHDIHDEIEFTFVQ